MSIHERLKKLRTERNLTHQQVADGAGIERVSYTRYENGKRVPNSEAVVGLANFFGCTTDYLLGRTDEENLVRYELPKEYDIDGESVALNLVKEALDEGLTEQDIREMLGMVKKWKDADNKK